MRTASICPTCATYENAVCVLYQGEFLSNINVSPGDDLQTILASIDSTIDVMLASFQPLLGFTPEDVANKSTSVIIDQASNTKYPSVKAVFDWAVANFTPVLGFTPEDVANKSTNVVTDQASNTKYPSVKAVFDWATTTFQPTLGFTPENVANKSTDNTLGGLTPSNTLYPSQKAVKDYVTSVLPGSSGVQQVKISMTSADILGMSFASPFQLIAAPGAGKFIDLINVTAKYNFVTTAYSTGEMRIYIGLPSSGGILMCTFSSFLNNAFNVFNKPSVATSGTQNLTGIGTIENKPLFASPSFSAPTLGDGTVDLYITYSITNI